MYQKNMPGFVFNNPDVLSKKIKNKNLELFDKYILLPSATNNPCDTLYPFLVASLLRFAPYLIRPFEKKGKFKFNYCLSFARIQGPRKKALILPMDYNKLKDNSSHLIDSLCSVLDKNYTDEQGNQWSAIELANITIYLNAFYKIENNKDTVVANLNKMLKNKSDQKNVQNIIIL